MGAATGSVTLMSADPARRLTRIEQRRLAAGLSQEELAERSRLSVRTLQRLEHGEMENPSIRYLANLAIVLGCELEDLIEPEWREWADLNWGGRRS